MTCQNQWTFPVFAGALGIGLCGSCRTSQPGLCPCLASGLMLAGSWAWRSEVFPHKQPRKVGFRSIFNHGTFHFLCVGHYGTMKTVKFHLCLLQIGTTMQNIVFGVDHKCCSERHKRFRCFSDPAVSLVEAGK